MTYTKNWSIEAYGGRSYSVTGKGLTPVSSDNRGTVVSRTCTRTGSKVDNWREKIAKGELAASPYYLQASEVLSSQPGDAWARDDRTQYWVQQTFNGFISNPAFANPPSVPTVVQNRALAKILERIRSEYEHTSVMPQIAELRQTLRQFGAPASAVFDLTTRRLNRIALEAKGYKGSTSFKRAKLEKHIASTYLEYSFGLAPLIEDTREIAEAAARWNFEGTGEIPRETNDLLTAYATGNYTDHQYLGFPTGNTGSPFNLIGWRAQRKDSHELGVKYVVKLRNSLQADFGSVERLKQLLGLDPRNLLTSVWEAVPWSWLIDYFLNIQQILEAGVTHTENIDWIIKTERRVTTSTLTTPTYPAYKASGYTFKSDAGHLGQWTTRSTVFTRSLPGSLGIPQLTTSYPTSPKKLANMTAALLARRVNSAALWFK
jgi:hypothetical protein